MKLNKPALILFLLGLLIGMCVKPFAVAQPLTMPVWKCMVCGAWHYGTPMPKRKGVTEPV